MHGSSFLPVARYAGTLASEGRACAWMVVEVLFWPGLPKVDLCHATIGVCIRLGLVGFAVFEREQEDDIVTIAPYETAMKEAVVRLSLRAWEPVFVSLRETMDPAVYDVFFPDWRVAQREAVEAVCDDPETHVWVALEGGAVGGFVAVKSHDDGVLGEIYMIAVDPERQRHGVGNALIEHALAWMKSAGLTLAMVETGGDPGHGPARRVYERAGFGLFPVARYFKKL